MKKLYIFDFDGTLVLSMHMLIDKVNEILRKHNHKTLDFFMSEYKNDEALICGLDLILEGIIKEPQELNAVKEEILVALKESYKECQLMEGAREYLASPKNKGIQKVILTCNKREVVQNYLKEQGLTEYFEAIIGCEDLIAGKKNKTTFRYVMNLYEAAPENCTVFEDSRKPMLEALEAGANCIYIDGENANGSTVIRNFTDLL